MGSINDKNPAYKIDTFLLAKYLVTNKIYLAFARQVNGQHPEWMEEGNKYNLKTGSSDHYKKFIGEDNPVVGVSWDNAHAFCHHYGLSLPTEVRWEYACRAGSYDMYYWGDTVDGNYFWYNDNSNGTTHKVGQKKPNAFGLYDMSGNVWGVVY